MYQFLLDALATLRMRYLPQEEYRYPITVLVAVIAVLTLVNAAVLNFNVQSMLTVATEHLPAGSAPLKPIFANQFNLIITAFFFTLLKWGVLVFSLQKILGYYGANKLQLIGFIFVTEALIIPELALIYAPGLALIGMIWQFWTFLVQINGVVHFSGLSPFKVIIGYIGYFAILLLTSFLVFGALIVAGVVDAPALFKIAELLQQAK